MITYLGTRISNSLSFSLVFALALQHAGKHMEDSIAASYTALLLGCLCQGSQVRISQHANSLCNSTIFSHLEIFMLLITHLSAALR